MEIKSLQKQSVKLRGDRELAKRQIRKAKEQLEDCNKQLKKQRQISEENLKANEAKLTRITSKLEAEYNALQCQHAELKEMTDSQIFHLQHELQKPHPPPAAVISLIDGNSYALEWREMMRQCVVAGCPTEKVGVIFAAMYTALGIPLDRVPSASTVARVVLEGYAAGSAQLGQEMTQEGTYSIRKGHDIAANPIS
jgi:hypothetical protein